MKEIKKYTDIVRYGKSSTQGVIKEGDIISITEKIDGANASFCIDNENPLGVSCYSRNNLLTEENRLRGYYDWILDNIVPIKEKLNPNYRYFGEWCVKHKVVYKEENYYKFYLFSIWDDEKKMYLSDEVVRSEAERLELLTVQYFYYGEYISFEHLMSFVGKSELTEEPNTGEGIVVKNVSYLDNHGRQVFVKLVSDKFREVQQQKKPKNPNVDSKVVEVIKAVLTKARVSKLIHKLVDEGLLKEDFAIEDMGTILRELKDRPYQDIMKEEPEIIGSIEEKIIKRTIGKNIPNIVKEVLKEENRM
ncbi:MAG: RNA ligase family protein [Clostridium perfringens]|nr:RNA ligase family protein [Clostridium perfringens]